MRFFLYGCESWTVTPWIECSLNDTYTRNRRKMLHAKWRTHTTNVLYGDLPHIGEQNSSSVHHLAGHCHRCPEMNAHKLLQPTHGLCIRGKWSPDKGTGNAYGQQRRLTVTSDGCFISKEALPSVRSVTTPCFFPFLSKW